MMGGHIYSWCLQLFMTKNRFDIGSKRNVINGQTRHDEFYIAVIIFFVTIRRI